LACAITATRWKWVMPQTAAVCTTSTAPAANSGRKLFEPGQVLPTRHQGSDATAEGTHIAEVWLMRRGGPKNRW
jgi:hypothetical protein